jgi:hypothetical protein
MRANKTPAADEAYRMTNAPAVGASYLGRPSLRASASPKSPRTLGRAKGVEVRARQL